ncbi:hypothetical protein A5675_02145 [Mycobacterium malmoense]|uniref:hypothetical protein n=1 Tax=Mycobacterium malmoense TaxID=1780 RepID=UPI00080BBDFF|nr:hypothetical protein [Mycobacterium malmoense]OCB33260.1 hypothetical protein A5675_02145 [Mycobacterium malmoense]
MTISEVGKPQVTICFTSRTGEIPKAITELTEELGRNGYTAAPFPLPAGGGGFIVTVGPLTILVGDWAVAMGYAAAVTLGAVAAKFGLSFAGSFGSTLGENFANDVYAKIKEKRSGQKQQNTLKLNFGPQVPDSETVAIEFVVDPDTGEQIGEARAVGPGDLRPAGLEPPSSGDEG